MARIPSSRRALLSFNFAATSAALSASNLPIEMRITGAFITVSVSAAFTINVMPQGSFGEYLCLSSGGVGPALSGVQTPYTYRKIEDRGNECSDGLHLYCCLPPSRRYL